MENRESQPLDDVAVVARLRNALAELIDRTRSFTQPYNSTALPNSIAASERRSFDPSEWVIFAQTIGTFLINYGMEHVSAFLKTTSEPVEMQAAFTCVRSMLEASALAAWVLDPQIDVKTRVSRTLSHRFVVMTEEMKLARAANRPAAEIRTLAERISHVEELAVKAGFSPIRNRDDPRTIAGLGERMPVATSLIEMVLNEGVTYRVLSAVAHGHYTAIRQLGYSKTEQTIVVDGVPLTGFVQYVCPDRVAFLAICIMTTIARPLWNECHYLGWNDRVLEEIFEDVADRLDIATERRFWRSYP